MTLEDLKRLIELWEANAVDARTSDDFRTALRADPAGTARKHGIALDADEEKAFVAADWKASDDALVVPLRVSP